MASIEPASADAARASRDRAAFIRANTRLMPVPHAPEIVLHLADEALPLWQKTEEELGAIGLPPPFWAFAWAGGQALARHLLDRPALAAGRRVLDLGSGSGLVAIAAAKAGAAPVIAADTDFYARVALELNAFANGVHVEFDVVISLEDAWPAARFDLVLVGDLFYERDTAARALAFLERQRFLGTEVLIGDPGRTYLPKERLTKLAEYQVPVTRDLEDQDIKRTAVWAMV